MKDMRTKEAKRKYNSHKNTRMSDSSVYDIVCEDCGITDDLHAAKNMFNTPCSTGKVGNRG